MRTEADDTSPCDEVTHSQLVTNGWVRRSMLAPERLREASETYTDLGYEVKVMPLDTAEFGPNCEACKSFACSEYRLLYTRKRED